MTHTMRERVVRALLGALDKQGVGGGIGWDVQHGDAGGPAQVEEYDPEAVVDAILAELREPDDAMINAVVEEWGQYDGASFTVMIDAIREGGA